MATNKTPTSVRERFNLVLRLLATLYVAACVIVSTCLLLGWGAMLGTVTLLLKAEEQSHSARLQFISKQFQRQPKQIDLTGLNDGDWVMACAIGQFADRQILEAASTKAGIVIPSNTLDEWSQQKFRPKIVLMTRNGTHEMFAPAELAGAIASGEAVCVQPSSPIMTLKQK
jgi:hypothetical protein